MGRSRQDLLLLCMALVAYAAPARAQPAIGVEIGASLAVHGDPSDTPGFSPRFSFGDARTAIEGFADIGQKRPFSHGHERGRLMIYGQLKRTLIQARAGDGFVVGMHAGYRLRQTGGFKISGPNGTVERPPEISHDWWRGLSLGGGYQLSLHRHLGIRADAQFGSTFDGPLLRASLGMTVPMSLGLKTTATRKERSVARARGPIVWVTLSDGRELKGVLVGAWTDAIDLVQDADVTTLPLSHIQLIQTTDRLGNGARAGAVFGALGLGVWAFGAVANSSDSDAAPIAGLFFAGIGAGLGALGGMLVDSFDEGRRVIYRPGRSLDISAVPVLSPTSAGARVAVTW